MKWGSSLTSFNKNIKVFKHYYISILYLISEQATVAINQDEDEDNL